MKVNGVELDWQAREVLEAIWENGGKASTSDVKAYTGFESNDIIKYRFGRLTQAGLAETYQPAPENGKPAAKVARLTDSGEELVSDGELDLEVAVGDDEMTIDERMQRMEKQMKRMRDTYGKVKKRIVEIEEDIEDVEGDVDGVAEDVRQLRRRIETDDGLASELDIGDD